MAAVDDFRFELRATLDKLLVNIPIPEREAWLAKASAEITQIYTRHSHKLLDEVIADAHMRLDARLAPDPIQQTIASVQTTVQDIWNIFFGPPPATPNPPPPALPAPTEQKKDQDRAN